MRKDDERQRSEEAASHLAGPARLSGFASHFTPVPLTISSAEGLGLRRDGRGTSVERSEASEDTKPEPSRRRPLLTVTAITNQSRLFLTSPSTPTLSLRLFTFRSVAEVGVGNGKSRETDGSRENRGNHTSKHSIFWSYLFINHLFAIRIPDRGLTQGKELMNGGFYYGLC